MIQDKMQQNLDIDDEEMSRHEGCNNGKLLNHNNQG